MDAAGRSPLARVVAGVLLLVLPLDARSGPPGDLAARTRQLYREQRWEEIVREIKAAPDLPAQLDYFRGMALAHLGRWVEARRALESGWKKAPRDERFPVELAGVAFKQSDFRAAKRNLHQALSINPKDDYALQFLGTLYFLEDNLDAAVENWNRIAKPKIRMIRTNPPLRTDPELLDRSFAIAPASVLKLGDLRTTRARLDQLGIFPRYRFDLVDVPAAQDTGDHDLRFSAVERNGWGNNKLEGFAGLLSGLPYGTVYPEYCNFRRSAINLTSLMRWDDQKRRIFLALSAPLHANPAWRFGIYVDGRNENWDLSRTFHAAGPPLDSLKLRRVELGGEIGSVVNGRWNWTTGFAVTRRTFADFSSPGLNRNPLFTNSFSLEYRVATNVLLLDRPENRFTLNSGVSTRLGRIFAGSSNSFERFEGSLAGTWFPEAQGDDYEMDGKLTLGAIRGNVPLDELFMLGLERDNSLPMRAHIGTRNGRKGNAPLGRDVFLSNWEIDKNIYENGWLKLRLAPFLDSGRITDGSGPLGEKGWLWDTGGEAKVRILGGLTVVLTYGKDLRTGQNAFYMTVNH